MVEKKFLPAQIWDIYQDVWKTRSRKLWVKISLSMKSMESISKSHENEEKKTSKFQIFSLTVTNNFEND